MDFLKKYWFGLSNLVFFLGVTIFYMVSVSSLMEDRAKNDDQLKRSVGRLRGQANQKPTNKWKDAFEKNKSELDSQVAHMMKEFEKSEKRIESYFSLENEDELTLSPPSEEAMLSYKELLTNEWDGLKEKFAYQEKEKEEKTTEEGGLEGLEQMYRDMELKIESKDVNFYGEYLCAPGLLTNLEPRWLRNAARLDRTIVREGQKQFWLVKEILNILKSSGVDRLDELEFDKIEREEPNAEYQGKMIWKIRNINISMVLDHNKIKKLMKRIHRSPFYFRIIGFSQTNKDTSPRGVNSSALFISFTEKPKVQLILNLKFFDLLDDKEKGGDKA